MIEASEYRSMLSSNIFNIISLEYVKSKKADPKKSYALGVLSSVGPAIATIAMLYQEDNKGDKTDIIQFHKAFFDINIFQYRGSNVFLMANEILKTKEKLVQQKMDENKDNLYTITYT